MEAAVRKATGLAGVILALVAGAARAGEPEPFEGYAALCGYPILSGPTRQLSSALAGPDGVEVIVLDPMLEAPRQRFHRLFLIAHECAHHRMDHTSAAGLRDRATRRHAVRDHEMSADCWAAETLSGLGMRSELLALADQFFRRGFVSPGQGYPSGIQRANIIRHCLRSEE